MKFKGSYIWATIIAVGVAGWMVSDNFTGSDDDVSAAKTADTSALAAANDETASAGQAKSFIVSAVTVENSAIRRVIRANGVSQPDFEVTVSAQITGTVIAVPGKEGSQG